MYMVTGFKKATAVKSKIATIVDNKQNYVDDKYLFQCTSIVFTILYKDFVTLDLLYSSNLLI